MDEFLARVILAARNQDVESWMNILFVVIIVVFWAVSGIIRAKVKKAPENEEESTEKLSRSRQYTAKDLHDEALRYFRRARSVSPTAEKRVPQQSEQMRIGSRKIGHPRPVTARIATEKKTITIPAAESLEKPNLAKYGWEIKPAILEQPELKREAIETLSSSVALRRTENDTYPAASSEKLMSVSPVDSLFDLNNADDLKKAIIHYEIIGKPLSLRDFKEDLTKP